MHVDIFAVLAAAVLVAGGIGAVCAVRRLGRALRRGLRARVAQLATQLRHATGGISAVSRGQAHPPAASFPVNVRWPQPGAGFLARARLTVAVRGAVEAVTQAAATGAPVGELPDLLLRLRTVSGRADAALRAGGRDCRGAEAAVTEATALSRRIRREAGAAAATVAQRELTGLADEIGDAVHGLQAAASWLAGSPETPPLPPAERAPARPAAPGPSPR